MKKILIISLALGIGIWAMAVPAKKSWQEKTQPDGTTIRVMLVGDEFYHYYINEAGEQVTAGADGYWQVVGNAPTPGERAARRNSSAKMQNKPRRVGSINMAPRGLFILANFSDKSFNALNTQSAMYDMMNATSYTYNGAVGSARQYFIDQSNGAYTPTFDVVGPVQLQKPCSYYGSNIDNEEGEDQYPGDMIVEACKLAYSQFGVDFTKYDNDKDGEVDFVYVIYAGMGEADGGAANTIWPHNWNLSSAIKYQSCTYTADKDRTFDGKKINNYACSGELNGKGKRDGIGTLCHEFSHVLGLPDFYDTEYSTNYSQNYTPGDWDIMDGGSYNGNGNCPPNYSPWEKYFFGWATPTILNKAANVTLTTAYDDFYQINANGTLASWSSTVMQYYIENRQNTGWDAKLPSHGMLVWKVQYDQDVWDNNEPNNTAYSPRYTLVAASGAPVVNADAKTPYPGSAKVTKYTPFTKYPLKDIAETSGNITFIFIEKPLPETQYTITWSRDGSTTTEKFYEGFPLVLAGAEDCENGREFVGWSASEVEETDILPTLVNAGEAVTKDATYYAVYGTAEETPAKAATSPTIIWAEDFTGCTTGSAPTSPSNNATIYNNASLTYSYEVYGTKLYNDVLAKGDTPELLIKSGNGSFAVSGLYIDGFKEMELSFKSNKASTTFSVSTTTGGIKIAENTTDGTWTITSNGSIKTLNLKITNLSSKNNARVDDFVLKTNQPGKPETVYTRYSSACDTHEITTGMEEAVSQVPLHPEMGCETVKMLNDGELIIIVEGVRYDIFGRQM